MENVTIPASYGASFGINLRFFISSRLEAGKLYKIGFFTTKTLLCRSNEYEHCHR